MLFDLKNALSPFQRAGDIILLTVKGQVELIYLDGEIIFLRSVEEHLNHLQTLFGLLSKACISFNLENCFFCEDHIDYLVHLIQPSTPGILTKATDTICKLQHATNVIELNSFLGLPNVIRRFVPILASYPYP